MRARCVWHLPKVLAIINLGGVYTVAGPLQQRSSLPRLQKDLHPRVEDTEAHLFLFFFHFFNTRASRVRISNGRNGLTTLRVRLAGQRQYV